jgi:2-C-methyl-D-erythritol 4-phosphate cytidylyltransferase
LIVAAGAGRRFQASVAKQFVELGGEPLLVRTVRNFNASACIDQIVIVLPATEITEFREALAGYHFEKVVDLIAGGAERQDSVAAGLAWSEEHMPEMILVHDGVRPFAEESLIRRVLIAAREHGAAIPAVRPADTVKRGGEGFVLETLDREELYLVQTPQAFRAQILRAAYDHARQTGMRATDEAALVEAIGYRVALVEGSPRNMKITRKEDLRVAEMLLDSGTADES